LKRPGFVAVFEELVRIKDFVPENTTVPKTVSSGESKAESFYNNTEEPVYNDTNDIELQVYNV
jgi:hypothetical protein